MLQITPHAPLKTTENPILSPKRLTIAGIEADLHHRPHLQGDRRLSVRHVRRRCEDARKAKTAAAAIGTLPAPDEALHLAIGGRFALFHFVPAVIELATQPAAEVWIATLGFSRRNIDDLAAMIDAKQIGRLWLLASHYFAGTSPDVYKYAQAQLGKRPAAAFLSLRTHAKIVLVKLVDARTFTIESSANLRSCKNIEQATVIGDPAVFEFHHRWIGDLFAAARGAA